LSFSFDNFSEALGSIIKDFAGKKYE